eukprot:6175181-Prymnesium_polylepis.1
MSVRFHANETFHNSSLANVARCVLCAHDGTVGVALIRWYDMFDLLNVASMVSSRTPQSSTWKASLVRTCARLRCSCRICFTWSCRLLASTVTMAASLTEQPSAWLTAAAGADAKVALEEAALEEALEEALAAVWLRRLRALALMPASESEWPLSEELYVVHKPAESHRRLGSRRERGSRRASAATRRVSRAPTVTFRSAASEKANAGRQGSPPATCESPAAAPPSPPSPPKLQLPSLARGSAAWCVCAQVAASRPACDWLWPAGDRRFPGRGV